MDIFNDEETDLATEIEMTVTADRFAESMDDVLLDIADLDPVACPPDRRFFLGEREAWVYEHGNVCELVFVKTG